MTSTTTRQLEKGDIPQLAQLEKQVFGPEAWSPDVLAEELDSPWGDYLGVFTGDDSELVAYAGIKGVEEGDLMTLAVAEGWRRKGLGRSLTSDLLARAQARGMKKVFLEVRASNLGAQELYLGLGFVRLGVVRDYYRLPTEDAITMLWECQRTQNGGPAS